MQTREKFPPEKVGVIRVRVPDLDRCRCYSRNLLGLLKSVQVKIYTELASKGMLIIYRQ